MFTRVSLFSWGGGPASLALMQRETTAQGWVTPPEFADGVAVGSCPGRSPPRCPPLWATNWPGCRRRRRRRRTVVPATLLMLVMVVFFFGVKDSPAVKAMLQAVRPVVVGLLMWTAYDMAVTVFGVGESGSEALLLREWDKILIAVAAFALLTFTKVNPAVIILGAAALGFGVYR